MTGGGFCTAEEMPAFSEAVGRDSNQQISEKVSLRVEIGKHALDPPVLVLQGFHPTHYGPSNTAIFSPTLVVFHAADPKLTAQLRYEYPALRLAQLAPNLDFGETARPHWILCINLTKITLRLKTTTSGRIRVLSNSSVLC